jgi:hypothetical protein
MLFDQAWVEVVLWAAVAIAVGTFANYIRQAAAMMARSGETSTRP